MSLFPAGVYRACLTLFTFICFVTRLILFLFHISQISDSEIRKWFIVYVYNISLRELVWPGTKRFCSSMGAWVCPASNSRRHLTTVLFLRLPELRWNPGWHCQESGCDGRKRGCSCRISMEPVLCCGACDIRSAVVEIETPHESGSFDWDHTFLMYLSYDSKIY